jgi:hypothetical protein
MRWDLQLSFLASFKKVKCHDKQLGRINRWGIGSYAA